MTGRTEHSWGNIRFSRRDAVKLAVAGATALALPELLLTQPVASAHMIIDNPLPTTEEKPGQLVCGIDYWHEVYNQNSFEKYIYDLFSTNRHPISLSQIADYFETGVKSWPDGKTPRCITFDDGYKSQYDNARPILKKWSVPATFAVMPDWVGDGDPDHVYMNNDHIKELSADWEIASHTFHHANLPALRTGNNPDWQAQIITSKKRLEHITGKEVRSFVYPYGGFDKETVELVAKHYRIAAKTGGGVLLLANQIHLLPRQSKS